MYVQIAAELKKRARDVGFDPVGIASAEAPPNYTRYLAWLKANMHGEMAYLERHAELRAKPDNLLPGAKSLLMVGLNYARPPAEGDGARIATYALGRDYHKVVRSRLKRIGKLLEEWEPGAQWRVCVDSAPLLERDYAMAAGLGWYGKNTCLINTERGSLFLLGCLLTTLDLPPDPPAVGGCGTCTACLDTCPTGAIVEPFRLDARRCISYLTIEKRGEVDPALQPMMGDWLFGCDVCQDVCPFNHPRENSPLRARPTEDDEMLPRIDERPALSELLALSPEEFAKRYSGTAIMRAGVEGMRRNAEIAERQRRGRPSPDF